MTMKDRIIKASLETALEVVNLLPRVYDFIDISDMEIEARHLTENPLVEFHIHSTRKISHQEKIDITHYIEEETVKRQLHTFANLSFTIGVHVRYQQYKKAIHVCYDI